MSDQQPSTSSTSSSAPSSNATSTTPTPPAPQQSPPPQPQQYSAPPPPLREPYVQNAVKFLSDARTTSAPASQRYKFLESKDLNIHEIAEALRRINPNQPDYTLLQQHIQQGTNQLASQIAAGAGGSAPAASTTSTTTTTAQPSYQTSTYTPTQSYSAPTQQQPVLYAVPQRDGTVLYTTTPPSHQELQKNEGTGWLASIATFSAIAGTGALASYLYSNYMPRIKFEPRHPPAAPNHDPTITLTPQQQHDAALALVKRDGASAVQNASREGQSNADRYGLGYLTGNYSGMNGADSGSTDDQTYKAVLGVKSEMRDVVDLLREQTTDIKRALNTIQLSLEVVSRRSREKDRHAEELNETLTSIRQLIAKQQSSSSSASVANDIQPSAQNLNRSRSSTTVNDFPLSNVAEKWNAQQGASSSLHKRTDSLSTAASQNGLSISTPDLASSQTLQQRSVSPESIVAAAAPSSAAAAPSSGSYQLSESAIQEKLSEGETALTDALNDVKQSNSSEEIRMSVSSMMLYIGNILSHMNETKYRRIMLSNTAYNSRVRRVKGAERYLLAAGFEIRGSYIEWSDERKIRHSSTGEEEVVKEEWKHKLLQTALDKLNNFQSSSDSSTAASTASITPAASANPTAATQSAPPTSSSSAASAQASGNVPPNQPAMNQYPVPWQQQQGSPFAYGQYPSYNPGNPYQNYPFGGNAANNFMPANFNPYQQQQFMQQQFSNANNPSNATATAPAPNATSSSTAAAPSNSLQPPQPQSYSATAPTTPQRSTDVGATTPAMNRPSSGSSASDGSPKQIQRSVTPPPFATSASTENGAKAGVNGHTSSATTATTASAQTQSPPSAAATSSPKQEQAPIEAGNKKAEEKS